jgi:hypothetical protein
MVKLIVQGKKRNTIKKHQVQEPQKVKFFGKSSGVIPWVSKPGINVAAGALMWSHQVTGL